MLATTIISQEAATVALSWIDNSIDKTENSEKVKVLTSEEVERWSILGDVKDWIITILRNIDKSWELMADDNFVNLSYEKKREVLKDLVWNLSVNNHYNFKDFYKYEWFLSNDEIISSDSHLNSFKAYILDTIELNKESWKSLTDDQIRYTKSRIEMLYSIESVFENYIKYFEKNWSPELVNDFKSIVDVLITRLKWEIRYDTYYPEKWSSLEFSQQSVWSSAEASKVEAWFLLEWIMEKIWLLNDDNNHDFKFYNLRSRNR